MNQYGPNTAQVERFVEIVGRLSLEDVIDLYRASLVPLTEVAKHQEVSAAVNKAIEAQGLEAEAWAAGMAARASMEQAPGYDLLESHHVFRDKIGARISLSTHAYTVARAVVARSNVTDEQFALAMHSFRQIRVGF